MINLSHLPADSALFRITEKVKARLEERKSRLSAEDLSSQVKASPSLFEEAFRSGSCSSSSDPRIIAEIKFSSPSEGRFEKSLGLSPVEAARAYLQNGATALSVLTEQDYFNGNPDYLITIRRAMKQGGLPRRPLLMKDFVVDEFQLLEAKAWGADAVLLMVSLLGETGTKSFLQVCDQLGLTALVEVHDEEEMQIAARVGARVIGVNNRNLKTLQVSVETSLRLVSLAPKGSVLISESGLKHGQELSRLQQIGYSGFLLGTAMMKTGTPGVALAQILSETRESPYGRY